jgi:uncharacterized protein YbjT (DUF2867 family)
MVRALSVSVSRVRHNLEIVAIVGATGMVGGYVLRYALDHNSVETVTAIGRKKLGMSHFKLQEVRTSSPREWPRGVLLILEREWRGPDRTKPLAFARYKREAENAPLAAGFPQLYIFRPAYIYPVEPRNEPNFSYRMMRAIYPAFRLLFPNHMISGRRFARDMVDAAVRRIGQRGGLVFENRDIPGLVQSS